MSSLPSWKSRASLAGVRNPLNVDFFSQQQSNSSAARHERCTYFLSRKKRLCSHRVAAPGLKFCTLHEPSTLMQLQSHSECSHVLREIISTVVARFSSPMPPPRVISSASATVTAARTEASREQATQGHASVLVGKRKRRRKARTSAPKRMVNPFSTYYSRPFR